MKFLGDSNSLHSLSILCLGDLRCVILEEEPSVGWDHLSMVNPLDCSLAHLDCLADCSLAHQVQLLGSLADCSLVEVLDLVLRLFGMLRLADLTVIECRKQQRSLTSLAILGPWEKFGIVGISHLLSSGLVELEFVKLVFHFLTEVA